MSNGKPIVLEIRGLGHVPSFKNTKSIFRDVRGRPFIATKPARKAWMERAIRLIESQLRSLSRTIDPATLTVPQQLFAMYSSLPLDDSCKWIRELHVSAVRVRKGEEGARIVITQSKD